jgi:RHS repeat-associated protein
MLIEAQGSVCAENVDSSYYRARYYDPSAGRFLNEDPIAFGGGIDFYRYVMNSPVNKIDPRGLQEHTPDQPCLSYSLDPCIPPPSPKAPSLPPGWDKKGRTGGPLPPPQPQPIGPGCSAGEVHCTFSGEFKDPSVDPKFKLCSYSCTDGISRVWWIHIGLPCPPTPDRLPQ